ncbi:Blue-light photoreceptor [Aquicella siphonis]|uniref:Blue-light photoreceptor n=1 Tax=Aquicella siphonis TaxID=254247 RepID=A0A5E4PFV5_9COXI|nr:PAS domain-containing protein [Aquicella siphonis]VVC75724.1 Blue-light photoreceptor [Aquicella siphonis]
MGKLDNKLSLLLQFIDLIHVGIVICDQSLNDEPIVFANAAIEHITGYKVGEVLGRNCRFLQNGHTHQQGLLNIRQAIKSGIQCREIILNFKKNNSPFLNDITIMPIKENGRNSQYIAGILTEVKINSSQEIAQIPERDHETGLYNYRTFYLKSRELIAEAQSKQKYFAIGIVAVEFHHLIDEVSSYLFINNILTSLSKTFLNEFKSEDVITRLGDKNFLFGLIVDSDNPLWFTKKISKIIADSNKITPVYLAYSSKINYMATLPNIHTHLDQLITQTYKNSFEDCAPRHDALSNQLH